MEKIFLLVIFQIASQWLVSQSKNSLLDDYINSYVSTGDFSGCISIRDGSSILYEKCFSHADHENEIKNTSETRFMIGSISKQFTAAGILLLEEENLLSLEDTLGKFFPEKELVSKVSLLQLLTHQSGVVDVYDIHGLDTITQLTKITGELMDRQPYFDPGSSYSYSNGGYAILARIIEVVSGTTYQQFLKKRIFEPLKMGNTGHMEDFKSGITAKGYNPIGFDKVVYTPIENIHFFLGSGSITSTLDDLNIWIESISSYSLLSEKSTEKLLNNYGNNYGLGISVYSVFGKEVYGHDGRITGYIADYLHYKEEDINIVILGNIQTGVVDFLRRDLAAIIFDKENKTKAKKGVPVPLPQDLKDQLVGTYQFGPNFNVFLEFINDRPMVKANEGSFSEIVPLKDGNYFNRMLYSSIRFKRNSKGEISEMVWINNDGNNFSGVKTQ